VKLSDALERLRSAVPTGRFAGRNSPGEGEPQALRGFGELVSAVSARRFTSGDRPGGGKPQAPCGLDETVSAVSGVSDENVDDFKMPSPGVSPVAAHALAAEFSPASSKVAETSGDTGDNQQRRGFGVSPLAASLAETPETATDWTDDRAWIAEIVRHKDPHCDAVLALLFSWVLAAGGWINGMTAELPALPHRLAAVELRRMLRRSGIGIGPLP